MNNYTVIGFSEKSGQISIAHTQATNKLQAFYVVAQSNPQLTFVSVHDGHQREGLTLELPGEGVVDSTTVLEQADVFNVAEPEAPNAPGAKTIDPDLLEAIKYAFNVIPNKKLGLDDYPDTYSLASALSRL